MNKIDFKKHILPHLVAVVIFFLITVFFTYPVFLENKELSQNDILQWQGGAKELLDYRERTGDEGLWTNSMFGGMPAYLVNLVYKSDVPLILQAVYTIGIPHPVRSIFAGLIGFYIMLLAFKVRPYLALAGAVAFGINTFSIISLEAGHNAKVMAAAHIPLIIAGVRLALNRHLWWGFALTAFGLALQLKAGHLQITYYTLLILLFYGISEIIYHVRRKETRKLITRIGLLVVAAIIAIGANMGRVLPVYEYGKYSIRGASELTAEGDTNVEDSGLDRDYAFNWSSGVWETFTLIVPNFYGGATVENVGMKSVMADELADNNIPRGQIRQLIQQTPTYWGSQPSTAGPIYAGAIICLLFVIGIFFVEKRYRIWLIGITVFSILLSWGKNLEWFNYLMFDYFPGYNKFRSVSMTIYMALFAMPLLGFLGLENVLDRSLNKKDQKDLIKAIAITAGLVLLIIIVSLFLNYRGAIDQQLASSYPDWFVDALRNQRASMLRTDAFRSLFFIGAAGATLYFLWREKLSKVTAFSILGLLVFLDIALVGKRYLNDENFVRDSERAIFTATEADQRILSDSTSYRVLNLNNPFNDARTSYFHQSIGGYHGAKLRRYQDLIDNCLSEEITGIISSLQNQSMSFPEHPTLNMLNTKYFVAGQAANAVIPNQEALSNAWLVSELQPVGSPDEEIDAVCSLEPNRTAVIDTSKFEVDRLQYSSQGTVELTTYEPGHLVYEANLEEAGFAVFSEIYYPVGWTVTVDGNESDIKRVNYILRGLQLPAGEYEIEFNFEPGSYTISATFMWIFGLILILILLGTLIASGRRIAKNAQDEDD